MERSFVTGCFQRNLTTGNKERHSSKGFYVTVTELPFFKRIDYTYRVFFIYEESKIIYIRTLYPLEYRYFGNTTLKALMDKAMVVTSSSKSRGNSW